MYKRMSLPSLSVAPTIVSDLVFTKNKPDEGDETSAVCEWAGSPTPEVTWLKDEEPLDKGELPSRIRIVSTNDFRSELQIREVTLDDTGDYVCNVSNPVGFAFQRKSLDVRQGSYTIRSTCKHTSTCTKIIQLNEWGCRDASCEKSWKQGNPLSNTIKDTSTIMRNPFALCRDGLRMIVLVSLIVFLRGLPCFPRFFAWCIPSLHPHSNDFLYILVPHIFA